MNNYVVYIHKNKINGKVYIGQTNNIKRRWKGNGSQYKTSPHFWNAIEKYGWNNFEHIVIKNNLNADQADLWEKYYIKQYNATDSQCGYNILSGGNNKLKNYWSLESSKQQQSKRRIQYFENNPQAKELINKNRIKKIQCIETKEIFNSQASAARAYNINPGNLSKHLKGDKNYSFCGKDKYNIKLHWRIIES